MDFGILNFAVLCLLLVLLLIMLLFYDCRMTLRNVCFETFYLDCICRFWVVCLISSDCLSAEVGGFSF